ncbi:hypothetical protein M501DRAFT_246223 [Patellaria atrata CBS 101060]|uniref:Uncharacterized protein n=1 Tax=Patellaria atrata CBS 101060 TaxID=1346257 RepID=A0A9P4S5F7_9PEZI|nr:hypothetical protein M501DRAFT_246223 [Patellaria atrata CBS 101060]
MWSEQTYPVSRNDKVSMGSNTPAANHPSARPASNWNCNRKQNYRTVQTSECLITPQVVSINLSISSSSTTSRSLLAPLLLFLHFWACTINICRCSAEVPSNPVSPFLCTAHVQCLYLGLHSPFSQHISTRYRSWVCVPKQNIHPLSYRYLRPKLQTCFPRPHSFP